MQQHQMPGSALTNTKHSWRQDHLRSQRVGTEMAELRQGSPHICLLEIQESENTEMVILKLT